MRYKWDVFLSHSSSDEEVVGVVAKDLVDAGLRIWWYQSEVAPADRIREAVYDGVRNSAAVLIFISSKSLRSRWVLNELDATLLKEMHDNKTILIPILIGRVSIDELPEDMRNRKLIDLRFDFPRRYEQVKDALVVAVTAADAYQAGHAGFRIAFPAKDEFAAVLANYRYRGLHDSRPVSSEEVAGFGYFMAAILFEDTSDPDRTQTRHEFVRRYGLYILGKLALLTLEEKGLSFTKGVGERDLVELLGDVDICLIGFSVQRKLSEVTDSVVVQVGFRKDGKLAYWIPH